MHLKLNNILVRVNLDEKLEIVIGNTPILSGKRYSENFREKNPVVAEIIEGFGDFKQGSFIICNYNHFDDGSPYHLYDDLYAIPCDDLIYGIVSPEGDLSPVNGNILCFRIEEENILDTPPELQKKYNDRGIIAKNGYGFYKGDLVLFCPYSDYEIVYFWKGVEKRYIKVDKSEIVGVIPKKYYVK